MIKKFLIGNLIFFSFIMAMAKPFTINLGFFQLSISRILLIVMSIIFLANFKIYQNEHTTYSVKFVSIWFVYAILQGLYSWTISSSLWIKAVFFVSWYTLLALIFVKFITKIKDIKNIFYIIQMAVVVQMGFGIYEYLTRNYLFIVSYTKEQMDYMIAVQGKALPFAAQGNPNNFALLMLTGFFVSFACFKFSEKIVLKIFSLAVCGASVWFINLTGSRACLLGLALGIAFMIITNKKIRKKTVIILLAVLAGVTFLLLFGDVIYNIFINKILGYSNSSIKDSDNYRLSLISEGIRTCLQTLGMGTGAFGYSLAGQRGNVPWHNWWIEILTNYGLYIFIGYLIFYVKLFLNLFRSKQTAVDNDTQSIAGALCGFMVAFIISSISPASTLQIEWMGMIWAVIICFEKIIIVYKQKPQSLIINKIKDLKGKFKIEKNVFNFNNRKNNI